MSQLSCVEEEGEKRVNMAHLAIIGMVFLMFLRNFIKHSDFHAWKQIKKN